MAKIIIYNVNTQALEIFYRGENETMPYTYGTTMKVKEFRGSSSSSVLWSTTAAMESWNATRRSFNAPIPFRYAFKRIWEGGHGQQSQHYAGVAFDCGQALSSSERNRLWRTANNLGVWSYVEPQSMTPTRVHMDKRYGTPALQCRLSNSAKRQQRNLCACIAGCIKRSRIFNQNAGWCIRNEH